MRGSASAPPSFIMRSASTRAASTNVTSFIRFSACSGVLVRVSRTDAALAAGGVEVHHRRRRRGPLPERVEAAAIEFFAVILDVVSVPRRAPSTGPRADTASRMARRSCSTSSPPIASAWSRTISARQAEPRAAGQQPVLGISLQQLPGWPRTTDDMWRSSRWSSASPSRPSRCARTRSPASRAVPDATATRPATPKSSTVFTRPVPKYICQKRFTATRAVSGCRGIDQPARKSQPVALELAARQRWQHATAARLHDVRPGRSYAPRISRMRLARLRPSPP